MRIVCVSDTHGRHHFTEMPPGDILVHAGDITLDGSLEGVKRFNDWLGTLNHLYRYKVVICGNHDWCFQHEPDRARAELTNAVYLEDSGCEIEGLKFYGSPWTPLFCDWAFMLQPGTEIAAKWALIPERLDVLITHGPPDGILDRNRIGACCGCRELLYRVLEVKPRMHVFGHIHEAAGHTEIDGTLFVNAATHMGRGAGVVFEWDALARGRGS